MSQHDSDIKDMQALLLAMYNECGSADTEGVRTVISRLTAAVPTPFLNERAQAVRTAFTENTEYETMLTGVYRDCCREKNCTNCVLTKFCNTYIAEQIAKYDPNAPVIVDLFCGAGGLSLGFVQNGFRISLANDIEPCCVETYAHNHPEVPREHIIQGDINEIMEDLPKALRFQNVDVVIGGPPCQGFSMANRQRLIDDPRNRLYTSYVRVVSMVRPKFFVMENVKGMYSVSSQVIEDFNAIGYTVTCHILNAKDYGVPQNRERLIFIGNRMGIDNEMLFEHIAESAERIPDYVLKDALYGLRELKALTKKNSTELDSEESGRKIERNKTMCTNDYLERINGGVRCPVICNHKARYNNDRDIEIFGRLNQGDRSDDPKIADIMPYARRNDIFKDKYFKLEKNKVCKTITAHMKFDCNMYIHPTQARGLTPREAARVQSYPDDYFFKGAFTKTYMQVGNSVPPLLSFAIAEEIKKYL